jgi:Family of unknown function (DUF5362)
MENNYQSTGGLFEFGFDEQSKPILKSIGKWAKITAIVAFISYALSLVASFLGPGAEQASAAGLGQAGFIGGIVGTLLVVVIGVVINVFLLRFATEIVEAINISSQPKLESAFSNLKTYFQIIGIIVVILLVIFVFAFLFALILGGAGR